MSSERDSSRAHPLVTVGITVHARRETLVESLRSVLASELTDVEVLVGNDFPPEPITAQGLGIDDKRVRFINHPVNLGEAGNLNSLLRLARGRCFTWLADGDLQHPQWLAQAVKALRTHNGPVAAFSGYQILRPGLAPLWRPAAGSPMVMTGPRFLDAYLGSQLGTIGIYGVFPTGLLRQWGGAKRLSVSPFALLAEYLLLVQAGTLRNVLWFPEPMMAFGDHPRAPAGPPAWLADACCHFMEQAGVVLLDDALRPSLRRHLTQLLFMCINVYSDQVLSLASAARRHAMMKFVFNLHASLAGLRRAGQGNAARSALADSCGRFVTPAVVARLSALPLASLLGAAGAHGKPSVRPFWAQTPQDSSGAP